MQLGPVTITKTTETGGDITLTITVGQAESTILMRPASLNALKATLTGALTDKPGWAELGWSPETGWEIQLAATAGTLTVTHHAAQNNPATGPYTADQVNAL